MGSVLGSCLVSLSLPQPVTNPEGLPICPQPSNQRESLEVSECSSNGLPGESAASAVPSPGWAPTPGWIASRNPCDPLVSGSTETHVEEVAFELSLGEGRGFAVWVRKWLTGKGFTQRPSGRKTRKEKKRCISRNEHPSDHGFTFFPFPLAILRHVYQVRLTAGAEPDLAPSFSHIPAL